MKKREGGNEGDTRFHGMQMRGGGRRREGKGRKRRGRLCPTTVLSEERRTLLARVGTAPRRRGSREE